MDCPVWAERHWVSEDEANTARDRVEHDHRSACPGAGRLQVIADSRRAHPEQLTAAEIMGTYDADELLLVPAWAVHTAAGLAGLVVNFAARGMTVQFGNDELLGAVAGPIFVTEPQPGRPDPETSAELSDRLRGAAQCPGLGNPAPMVWSDEADLTN